MSAPSNSHDKPVCATHGSPAGNGSAHKTAASAFSLSPKNTTANDTGSTTDERNRPFLFDKLILASASPRRSLLLAQLGLGGFTVEVAQVTEDEDPASCPRQMVCHNAQIKAEAISHKHPRSLVLGADTTVALEGEVLNKPDDLSAARAMLHKLSNRTHTVYTGVCLISPADSLHEVHYVTSKVTFRPLDDEAIDAYFRLVNPLDKAGAYGIQEGRELIIERLEGSLENVMGLPIQFLAQRLRQLGCLEHLQKLHPPDADR